jgi:hypothetical protein
MRSTPRFGSFWDSDEPDWPSVVREGEHLPRPADALELVATAVLERQPGAVDEVASRARGEDVGGSGEGEKAGGPMHGDAPDVVADDLDLARVDGGPDLEVESRSVVPDGPGTGDRPSRGIEPGKEAVIGRLDLDAGEPVEGATNAIVVSGKQGPPASISEARRDIGRAHDVREPQGAR